MRILKITAVVALIATTFSACNKLDELTKFNMNYTAQLVVPSQFGINLPVTLNTPETQTNFEDSLSINDSRKDLVESVKAKEMYLQITSPSGKTFSFLKDISVLIAADGLPEQEVAYKTNIDNSVGTGIQLDLRDVELQEYLKKDKFVLKAVTTTDELLTQDVYIDIKSRFLVDAKILGL